MRILATGLLFFFYFLFFTFAVPPSPAGGGYFRIYKPGDYALASDHKDFEVSPEKTGLTIEMWIYLEQPMREFVGAKDKEKQIPGESWVLIYKAGNYQLRRQRTPPYLPWDLLKCSRCRKIACDMGGTQKAIE